jgi:hypothetical protein
MSMPGSSVTLLAGSCDGKFVTWEQSRGAAVCTLEASIGFAAAIAVAISIMNATSPWIFVVPLVAWAIVSVRRHLRRDWGIAR